jgi:hypothetical protein
VAPGKNDARETFRKERARGHSVTTLGRGRVRPPPGVGSRCSAANGIEPPQLVRSLFEAEAHEAAGGECLLLAGAGQVRKLVGDDLDYMLGCRVLVQARAAGAPAGRGDGEARGATAAAAGLLPRPRGADRPVRAIDVVFRRTAELLAPRPLPPGFEPLAGPERTAEVWAMLEEAAAFDSFEEALAFSGQTAPRVRGVLLQVSVDPSGPR